MIPDTRTNWTMVSRNRLIDRLRRASVTVRVTASITRGESRPLRGRIARLDTPTGISVRFRRTYGA